MIIASSPSGPSGMAICTSAITSDAIAYSAGSRARARMRFAATNPTPDSPNTTAAASAGERLMRCRRRPDGAA